MRRFGCSVFWKACAKGYTSRLRRNDFSSDFASILRNAIAIFSLSDGFQKKSAFTFSVCMDKNAGYLAHIPSMHPLSCIIFIFLHLFYHRFTNLPSLRHDPARKYAEWDRLYSRQASSPREISSIRASASSAAEASAKSGSRYSVRVRLVAASPFRVW